VVRVGRREIGVFNLRGELYGLPNVCPHQTRVPCTRASRLWAPSSRAGRTTGGLSG